MIIAGIACNKAQKKDSINKISHTYQREVDYDSNVMPLSAQPKKVGLSCPTCSGPMPRILQPTELPPDFKIMSANQFIPTKVDSKSTFSIDVDTASYSVIRNFLNKGSHPPKDAIRIEEMINYFSYDYPAPSGKEAFSISMNTVKSPWHSKNYIVHLGLQGKKIDWNARPKSNLVFLMDVSGSMMSWNKLPLLKRSLKMLVQNLSKRDRIAIVVYAGASGLVLDSTSCKKKDKILAAIDQLTAGGSTNAGAGIELAYKIAKKNFISNGINRVILASDGDFNVGITSLDALTSLIQKKAKEGVFLSVLGFGNNGYKDSSMETLADRGNGNYYYIDTFQESKKVLSKQLAGTMMVIAKDVKIQVEFNPIFVKSWRLIGYENRVMAHNDFNDDKKDAGDIGAGHTITAMYEIEPTATLLTLDVSGDMIITDDKLKYGVMKINIRYKDPKSHVSQLISMQLSEEQLTNSKSVDDISDDVQFAIATASFGMQLRKSKYIRHMNYKQIIDLAKSAKGDDPLGYRSEMIRLMTIARDMK